MDILEFIALAFTVVLIFLIFFGKGQRKKSKDEGFVSGVAAGAYMLVITSAIDIIFCFIQGNTGMESKKCAITLIFSAVLLFISFHKDKKKCAKDSVSTKGKKTG